MRVCMPAQVCVRERDNGEQVIFYIDNGEKKILIILKLR